MSNQIRYIWVNGQVITDSEPAIPAESKGLMYGAGCFETIRSYGSKFLHLEMHFERLMKGMDYLSIPSAEILKSGRIRKSILTLLEKNGLASGDALVRIQVSDAGKRGYSISANVIPHVIITADPIDQTTEKYILRTADPRVVPSECRPVELKLSNSLHYMQAYREACEKGADDALMLTVDGSIAETAIANIFWKRGGAIYTPSTACDILPGIMRHIVLDMLAGRPEYEVIEGEYKPYDLKEAEHVWITNSIRQIQPVSGWNEMKYATKSPFFNYLINTFQAYTDMNLK
jgi:branched-subunit amino acid aminotransferase/4-amino-4-deoxychorismate lyase